MSFAEKMKAKAAALAASRPAPPPPKPFATLSAKLMEASGPPHPSSRVAQALKAGGVSRTTELERILAIPRRIVDLEKWTVDGVPIPDLTPKYIIEPSTCTGCDLCRKGPAHLWSIQNLAIAEAGSQGGMLAPMGVGSGKTISSLLVGAEMGARRIMLLVPAQVRDQLKSNDIPMIAKHYKLPLDRLHVVAYSELSQPHRCPKDALKPDPPVSDPKLLCPDCGGKYDILQIIEPDLIVCDEAHSLRHRASSRRKRIDAYLKEHPECRIVGLSGTITNRSLRDFAWLSEYALRKNSPVPSHYHELQQWTEAIDVPKTEHEERRAPGALMLLCNDEDEDVRAGFRRRLVETRGVVATSEGSIGTSLYLRASIPNDIPPEIGNALDELNSTWEIGGEELTEAHEVARVAKQIACGFYYVWAWPDGVVDTEWLTARATWHRAVREFLKRRARAGLDSPMLVANACEREMKGDKRDRMGEAMVEAWVAWKVVKDRPAPPTKPVWISKFMLRHIHQWAAETKALGEAGIIFYEHLAIEEALREERALPVFGGGEDAEIRASTEQVIAASMLAHGTGKNLQRFSRGLIITMPSNGTKAEQVYGRLHRPGQEADEVMFDICYHTLELRAAFAKATNDARYVEETTGQKQKLLYATRLGL